MYFWKLSALKRELAAAHLGEREALLYLLWLGGLATAGYALPIEDPNLWDHVDSAFTVAIFLLGAIYLYRCNGGASGTDFLGRYLSLT